MGKDCNAEIGRTLHERSKILLSNLRGMGTQGIVDGLGEIAPLIFQMQKCAQCFALIIQYWQIFVTLVEENKGMGVNEGEEVAHS